MRHPVMIDWKVLGAMLAEQEDKTQAEFFKCFLAEMDSWPTKYQKDMQLTSIGVLLSDSEQDAIMFMGKEK